MLVHDDIAYETRKIAVAEYITHRKGNIGGGGGGVERNSFLNSRPLNRHALIRGVSRHVEGLHESP